MEQPTPTGANKTYFIVVIALTFGLPAVSVIIDTYLHSDASLLASIGKWVVFWAVGVRLLMAGLRQTIKPAFTAKDIFHIHDPASHAIVRELGFANVCFGLVGLLSLFFPQWRMVSAFASGLFYGFAGIGHLMKGSASANERLALVTDLFLFVVLIGWFASCLY